MKVVIVDNLQYKKIVPSGKNHNQVDADLDTDHGNQLVCPQHLNIVLHVFEECFWTSHNGPMGCYGWSEFSESFFCKECNKNIEIFFGSYGG